MDFVALSFLVVWPVVVAKLLARGTWKQIFGAYGMYWGGLTLIGLGMGDDADWMFLIALLTTVFIVPLIVVFLKNFNAFNQKQETNTVTTTTTNS